MPAKLTKDSSSMKTVACKTAWSMPNKWTFQIPVIGEFLDRYLEGSEVIVDPFSGETSRGTINNDLARGGLPAEEFLANLKRERGEFADAVIFDPPYSPRQISEVYKSIGLTCTTKDTQNARLFSESRNLLFEILKPGGIAVCFGWQSSGLGKRMETLEILLVQHGGAHNDTICVAQRKPIPIEIQATFDFE